MQPTIATLWRPKVGSTETEYEDASSFDVGADGRLRIAVADGATEGMLSGLWARLLCSTFVDYPGPLTALNAALRTIPRAQQSWPALLEQYKTKRVAEERPLKWYEEDKLAAGAFATLVAAELRVGSDGAVCGWAVAVGDACAIQIRDNQVICSHPISEPVQFGTSPQLVRTSGRSAPSKNRIISMAPGDTLVLASDSVSEWIVRRGTERQHLKELLSLASTEFSTWAAQRIAEHDMKNDDLTLVRLTAIGA